MEDLKEGHVTYDKLLKENSNLHSLVKEMGEVLKQAKLGFEAAIEKCPKNNDHNFVGYAFTWERINLILQKAAKYD